MLVKPGISIFRKNNISNKVKNQEKATSQGYLDTPALMRAENRAKSITPDIDKLILGLTSAVRLALNQLILACKKHWDLGHHNYESQQTLCTNARISRRSWQKAQKILQDMGLLEVVSGKKEWTTNIYKINPIFYTIQAVRRYKHILWALTYIIPTFTTDYLISYPIIKKEKVSNSGMCAQVINRNINYKSMVIVDIYTSDRVQDFSENYEYKEIGPNIFASRPIFFGNYVSKFKTKLQKKQQAPDLENKKIIRPEINLNLKINPIEAEQAAYDAWLESYKKQLENNRVLPLESEEVVTTGDLVKLAHQEPVVTDVPEEVIPFPAPAAPEEDRCPEVPSPDPEEWEESQCVIEVDSNPFDGEYKDPYSWYTGPDVPYTFEEDDDICWWKPDYETRFME